ncbi:kinase [Paraconexibacter sp. AEG42_29]|uniref:Kinase n=1 Tax=Paraconexibacter sp. AEG42_29 TaxID=2997339 RepID=A0AAU7B3F9_9ACTN
MSTEGRAHPDPEGLLHAYTAPDRFWSTANVGEALPGVVTPLGWSVWAPAIELAMRDTFARMGALEPKLVAMPKDPSDRVLSIFYGRGALSVSFLCAMGDRLPGTSGDAIARQLLGEVPPELPMKRTLKRMPVVAVKMPYALAMIRRQVIAGTEPTAAWWTDRLRQVETADLQQCRVLLAEAAQKLIDMTSIQSRGVFVGVQSVYDQLLALIAKAGVDSATANALMAGQGSHAETQIIADLWELGRKRMTIDAFLAQHGYHGPREGELSSRVWREDPTPVLRLAEQYADRDESQHPHNAHAQRTRERQAAERELLARLPAYHRPVAKLILKLAVQRIPLRGVAKEALMRALDIVRATGRRMGTLLTEQGVLSAADDAFFFTADELIAGIPPDAAATVARRRAVRETLQQLDIPKHWGGSPEAFPLDSVAGDDAVSVAGIAASGGVVEGTVRLVHDPAFTDVDPGDILVCPTTDPSWASVLFLASALVVDIGGPLSHAAVVARELGIPCVIGTRNGTAILRDGDQVRVDGNDGTVEILERADTETPSPNGATA